jgi:hypothetical protein
MKWYTSPDGEQRIFYTEDEIEQIVDDELARAGLRPTPAGPVTDIEKLIELHLKAELDQYADLPPDVLGLTQFRPGQSPVVSINAQLASAAVDSLTAAPGLFGRWRATLAHEAAHVLLHRYLFEPDLNQMRLFDPPSANPVAAGGLMRCLKRDVGPATSPKDWREVQANRGMAALLMPRAVFKRVAFQRMAANSLTDVTVGSPAADTLATELAARFSVSRQAAAIRLETLRIAQATDSTAHLPGL